MDKDPHQYLVLLKHLLYQHMSDLPREKSQAKFINKNMRNDLFLPLPLKPKQPGDGWASSVPGRPQPQCDWSSLRFCNNSPWCPKKDRTPEAQGSTRVGLLFCHQ